MAKPSRTGKRALMLLCCISCLTLPAVAQLSTVFSGIFNEVLDTRLRLSPGTHGSHFLDAAAEANSQLVPALNSLIAGNISSFPLSSTSGGLLFSFSGGQLVRVHESLGPIFAENAKPLGQGKLAIEANYTYLNLTRFRGLPTDQMRFTFTHKDVTNNNELGDNPNENDLIDLFMDLHTHASLGALSVTYGVTNDIDVGVALPLVSVRMFGTANAVIDSYTFARLGSAHHSFGADTLHPTLTTQVPYDQSATGLGDVALRVKYSFPRGVGIDAAALLDVRFPTGKKEDFLGSGKTAVRIWGIISKQVGDITPHLNIGYRHKPVDLQSDAVEFRAGFDNKLFSGLTFCFDLLGQVDLNSSKAIHLAPGTATLYDFVPNGLNIRTVSLSNIPDRTEDNTVSGAAGFRYAPSDNIILLANILFPLNDGGLRAQVAPTVGVSINL